MMGKGDDPITIQRIRSKIDSYERSSTTSAGIYRDDPGNRDAEFGAIAYVVSNPNNKVAIESLRATKNDAFYFPASRALHKAVVDVIDKGGTLTSTAITEQLKATPSQEGNPCALDDVGEAVIDDLPFMAPQNIADADAMIKTVRAYHLRRQLVDIGVRLAREAASTDLDKLPTLKTNIAADISTIQGVDNMGAVKHISEIAEDMVTHLSDLQQKSEDGTKMNVEFPSCLKGLTDMGGHIPGELGIIAGRPAQGKSWLVLSEIENDVRIGNNILLSTPEMMAREVLARMLMMDGHINGSKYRKGMVTKTELKSAKYYLDKLKDSGVWIDATPGIEFPVWLERVSNLVHNHGLQKVYLDYLQLMRWARYENSGKAYMLEEVSYGLKGAAKTLGIPVIVAAQLRREVETRGGSKEPRMMSDIADSSGIEKAADWAISTYRPAQYDIMEDEFGNALRYTDKETGQVIDRAKVIVLKYRGGFTKDIECHFVGGRWVDLMDNSDKSMSRADITARQLAIGANGRGPKVNDDDDIPF